MADGSLGRAVLRTELDRSGLESGLRQARTSATNALTQIEQRATQSGNRIGSALSQGFSTLSQVNLSSILGTGGAIFALQSLAREAFNTEVGLRLLDRQMERNNISFAEGRGAVAEIAEELHVLPSAISDNVAQLLRAGLSMDEISAAFRGGAASALAFGKDASTGVDTVTAAIITGRSTLLDSIGIAQNLDLAYRDYAATLGTTVDKLDQTQRAQAAVQLITRYTKEEVEDLPFMFEGLGGASSDLATNLKELRIELGQELLPLFTTVIRSVSNAVGWIADLPEPIKAAGVAAATAAVGVQALAVAVGLLNVALGAFRGYAGIILGVASALGAVIGLVSSLRGETEDFEETARRTFSTIDQANTLPELREAAVQLRDEIGGSAQMQAWDNLIAKLDEGKVSAEEFKNELVALAQTSVTAPLQAQLAALEAELATLNVHGTIAAEFQEPQRLVDDLNDRIARFAGPESGLAAKWIEDLGVVITYQGRIQSTLETLMSNDDLFLAGWNEQELQSLWNTAQSFGRTIDQGIGENQRRAQELRQEIADVRAQLEAANNIVATGRAEGSTGGVDDSPPSDNDVADEILPPGSIAELEKRISGLKEKIKLAPDDQTRWELTVELQGLEDELKRMERAIRPRTLEIEVTVDTAKIDSWLDYAEWAVDFRLGRKLRDIFRDPLAQEGPTPRATVSQREISEALEEARQRRELERLRREAELERQQAAKGRERGREQRALTGPSEVVGDTGDWRDIHRVLVETSEAISLVDSRAQLWGETGDELAEKQAILRRGAEQLVRMGLDPEHALVVRLTDAYGELGRQIQENEAAQLQADRAARQRHRQRVQEQRELFGRSEAVGPTMDRQEQREWLRQQRERQQAEREAAAARRAAQQTQRGFDNEVTGATPGWEAYREVLAELRGELEFIEADTELFGDSQSRLEARTSALRDAIRQLLRMGFSPQSALLRDLIEQYNATSDAAEINADTILAQEQAAQAAAAAQEELAAAMQSSLTYIGEAPTALDTLIASLEELETSGHLTAEQLREVRDLLEELRQIRANNELADRFEDLSDTVLTVVGALDTLLSTDWSNGNQALEGLTSAAGDLVSLIPGLGPMIGGVIEQIGAALSSLLGDMRNGIAELREETKDIQSDFELIDISSLIQTKQVSRGGLLGLLGFTYTAIDEEASELGLSIAGSIEQGVLSGLRAGMDRFLETGDIEDLEFALQEGIYGGVTDALMTAIVQGGVIQGILGPKLLELTEAIQDGYESGNYSQAMSILRDIQAMVPKLASQLAPLMGELAELRPEDPNAPSDGPEAPGGGRQISEITGPTRDLLTDLLTPLASLVSVPSLMQEQLKVQEGILAVLSGRPTVEAPVGRPYPLEPDVSPEWPPRSRDAGVYVQGDLNLHTGARNARELYRDISNYYARAVRGRRA